MKSDEKNFPDNKQSLSDDFVKELAQFLLDWYENKNVAEDVEKHDQRK